MGQRVRGLRVGARRPDYIVCDDLEDKQINKNPKRPREIAEWIGSALMKTMDGSKVRDVRRFIYANNKFAPVMIQTILQELHPNWTVNQVNAYNPTTYEPTWSEKYTADYYRKEEEDNVLSARAEYNNDPHIEGAIFKDEHIQWGDLPRRDYFNAVVCHWDIAYGGTATSDYNACMIMGLKDKDYWYFDGFCQQTKMRAALEWMALKKLELAEIGVNVFFRYEAQFWNDAVQQVIEDVEKAYNVDFGFVKVDTPRSRKYERILGMHPNFQNKKMYFNKYKKAHSDTQIALSQLKGIEPGYKGHDDAPDAMQQCIEFLSTFVRYGGGDLNYRTGNSTRRSKTMY